eukprot:TRINITY_DN2707_c0_g1_i1.p1 TRINITY_DN2707_c0_g1~~TRINITY_DN2707_c0_g1_i1.p1  ORF type:complete len:302 (-),score=68.21 TRINITY_DN2707_c0_g1_i1:373-1278(-)
MSESGVQDRLDSMRGVVKKIRELHAIEKPIHAIVVLTHSVFVHHELRIANFDGSLGGPDFLPEGWNANEELTTLKYQRKGCFVHVILKCLMTAPDNCVLTCTLVELSHTVAHPMVISSALGGVEWEKSQDLPLFSSDPMMFFGIIESQIMDEIIPLIESVGGSRMPTSFRGKDEHGRTGHGHVAYVFPSRPDAEEEDSKDPLRVSGPFFAPSYGHSDLYPSIIPQPPFGPSGGFPFGPGSGGGSVIGPPRMQRPKPRYDPIFPHHGPNPPGSGNGRLFRSGLPPPDHLPPPSGDDEFDYFS